jgi:hypothetical protein
VTLPVGLARVGLALVLAACGSAASGARAGTAEPARLAQARQIVPATANIFGAGYATAPAPGGGGAGTMPPVWRLPEGTARIVTFPLVTGRVTPIDFMAPYNGPGGDGLGPTDVESWRGISGIVHRRNGMFLVGVFLGDAEPPLPAPPRLDFTDRERFDVLAPRIGQTFFVGDGRGRRYEVPAEATRLFLGFADGYGYEGPPGWYGNNAGELEVDVAGTLAVPAPALDRTAPVLSGARGRTVTAPRGAKRVRVTYAVTARDEVDGAVAVVCRPRSGTFFRLGRTRVSCSATDSSGNTGRAQFTVVVKRPR